MAKVSIKCNCFFFMNLPKSTLHSMVFVIQIEEIAKYNFFAMCDFLQNHKTLFTQSPFWPSGPFLKTLGNSKK